ncbi:MAG: protein phosphatase 2C domain-containing protein, partial [bacterium]
GMIKRLETDDRDYLTDRVEDLDRKVILVEESNMRQQENISVFESKVKRLDNHQKKIDNKVVLVILGLIVTLPLSVISTALSVSLFFRLDGINAELKRQQQTENEMKLEINRIKIKQQPAKNTSEQSSFNRISTR